ncbi:MAG: S8 family serine peptidase [Bacteroidia bacterium]
MKKILFTFTILMLVLSGGIYGQTFPGYFDGRIYVKVLDASGTRLAAYNGGDTYQDATLLSLFHTYGVTTLSQSFPLAPASIQNIYHIQFTNVSSALSFIADLQALSYVQYAEQVPMRQISSNPPSDYNAANQPYLSQVSAPAGWLVYPGASTPHSSNVVVAVIDNEILVDPVNGIYHQEFKNGANSNLWVNTKEIPGNGIDDDGNGFIDDINGFDVGNGDNIMSCITSNHDHGTHVAGIAEALTDVGPNTLNSSIASISWNSRLMAIKATTDASQQFLSNTNDGLYYAIINHADIINMSWGSGNSSNVESSLISWGITNGIIMVAAAGNSTSMSNFYPAAYPGVISVGSVNSGNVLSSFSNFGTWIDVMAPGETVFSSVGTGTTTYGSKSGTSMACPMVTALCALMKSYSPNMSSAAIKSCIESNCDNLATGNGSNWTNGYLGHGLIDVNKAILCIKNTAPIVAFTANTSQGCSNNASQIQLFDKSGGAPATSWFWTIPGATFVPPSTANSQNPIVSFLNTGQYSVTLKVTNSVGNNTLLTNNFLNITNCVPVTGSQANWHFGNLAGLNFKVVPPAPIAGSSLGSIEACATVSDKNGNVLFYTNGMGVWDKNNNEITKHAATPPVVLNGSWNSNPSNPAVGINNWSTTDLASAAQGVLIVPNPGNTNQYYIFTVSDCAFNSAPAQNLGLSYTIIDMSLNGNLGGIVSGKLNVIVGGASNFPTTEQLTAVPHCNGTDYWILVHGCSGTNDANLLAFQLSAAGLNATPVVSPSWAAQNGQAQGMLKASHSGSYVACVQRTTGIGGLHKAFVYNFDPSQGTFNQYAVFSDCDYSCTFSPAEQYLYTCSDGINFNPGDIIRYDLTNPALLPILVLKATNYLEATSMEMGPDNKIYTTIYNSNQLGVIAAPDNVSPMASHSGPTLGTHSSFIGLPNMIDAQVHVASPPPSFTVNYNSSNCNTVIFLAPAACSNTLTWDFGDGYTISGSGAIPSGANNGTTTGTFGNPTHTYNSGQYLVKLTINGQTVNQMITVGSVCASAINYANNTTLTSNTNFASTTISINGDITIPNGITLSIQNSEVFVGFGHRFIVQNGGKISINGTHVHACTGGLCGSLWYGIQVQPGGTVEIINYSIIEDAMYAVYPDVAGTTNLIPMLNIHNSIFNKNVNSVLVESYPYDVNAGNFYIITNCIFTCRTLPTACTSANFTAIQNALNANPVTAYPTALTLNGNRSFSGVILSQLTSTTSYKLGATGTGNVNIFDNLDFGCYIDNSFATIVNCQFQNITGNTAANSSYGGNAFGDAIFATIPKPSRFSTSNLIIGGTQANPGGNTFRNCFRAMDIKGYDFLTIDNNTIDNLQTDLAANFSTLGNWTGQYGIFLKPNGYTPSGVIQVNDNTINNCANAIHVNRAIGYASTQIRIACNTINAVGTTTGTATQYCNIGIHLQDVSGNSSTMPASSYQVYTNSATMAEKNAILCENILAGLDINSNNAISVHSSPSTGGTIANSSPNATMDVIRLNSCSNALVNNNLNLMSSPILNSNEILTGVYVYGGTSNSISGNYPQGLGTSFVFNNTGGTGTSFKFQNNIMTNAIYGLYLLNNAVIGTQGSSTTPAGNLWGVTPSSLSLNQTYSSNTSASANVNQYSVIYGNVAGCGSSTCTIPNSNGGSDKYLTSGGTFGLKPAPGSSNATPSCLTCACSNNHSFIASGTDTQEFLMPAEQFGTELNAVLTDKESNPERIWQNKKAAFDQIHHHLNEYGTDANLGSFHNEQLSTTIGQLSTIDELIAQGSYATAHTINNGILAGNLIEDNLVKLNTVLLEKLGDSTYVYTPTDKATIYSIANSCPLTNGPAVFKARALYDAMMDHAMNYMENCRSSAPDATTAPVVRTGPVTSAELHIYPNPNNGEMTVNYAITGDENAQLMIFDVNGKLMDSYLLKSDATSLQISNQNLANGVYMYRVVTSSRTLNTGRLVIIK